MLFISNEVTYKAVPLCRWECLVGALVQADLVVCRWDYFVGTLVQADCRLRRRMVVALHTICNLDSEDSDSETYDDLRHVQ